MILYASPCFDLNKYILSKLETIQRRALKMICVNSVPHKENLKVLVANVCSAKHLAVAFKFDFGTL